jgi:hypothetical protein
MGIQTIIDRASFITVDKKKLASQTISRSGKLLTAEVTSNRPYRFIVGVNAGYSYSDNRAVLEELDSLDITTEENVDIGSTNTGLSYITALQGTLGGSPTITSASNGNIVLNTISATGSGVALKKGDFIQPATGYRYPYQVTADVTWNATSITVPIHRNFIDQSGYTPAGKNVLLGSNVSWYVKMTNKPTYTIIPHDRFVLDSDVELVEVIT